MEKTLGGKVWSLVQLGCTLYVGQLALSALQKKYSAVVEQKHAKQKVDDKVDTASEDSFPASDPPSYGGHSAGPIH